MYLKVAFLAIFYFPRNLVQIGNGNGDDAVKLAQFLRLAMVWGILMVGSALALAGAVIQPVLA
jgi:ABC-type enterobactin transport system permease subunit